MTELSSEWADISRFLRGYRYGNDAPILETLAYTKEPIRAAQIYKKLEDFGYKTPRSKLYEVLKSYGEMGIIKKTSIEYPEGFNDWSRASQRRWRRDNGWKGVPPSFYQIDLDALKAMIRSKATEDVEKKRESFNNEVAWILNSSSKLITFLYRSCILGMR